MLTARDTVDDRVTGLDCGRRRLPREAVRLRGARGPAPGARPPGRERARRPDPAPDGRARSPRRDDAAGSRSTAATVDLSPREFSLLECLLRHPGQTLTRDQLLDQAWPFSVAVTPNAVDAYVHYLRTKLGAEAVADRDGPRRRVPSERCADGVCDRRAATRPTLDALAADNRLIRRVRWRLVAWSGLSTLLVLVVLGVRALPDRGPDARGIGATSSSMARADA